MSVETDFHALLLAHPPLVALVASRVAQHAVPEGADVPLVVYTVAHTPLLSLGNVQLADQCAITVQCWAVGALQADAVADAVVDALAGANGATGACVVARVGLFDSELQLDCTELSVEWWA
jgi:hypothetical protein